MSEEVYKLDEKEIIRLYLDKQLSILDISKKFNVNFGTIKLRLTKNNIPVRTQSQAKKIVMNKPEVKNRVGVASKKASKKRMETNIKRYGTAVASNTPQKRKEWTEDYFKKHGVDWNKDPRRIEKSRKTCLERYNVDNGSKSKNSKKKISQKRWKDKTEEELILIKNKSDKTYFKNNVSERINKMLKILDIELLGEYINSTTLYSFQCNRCKGIFKIMWGTLKDGYRCPICYPRTPNRISKGEKEVLTFMETVLNKKLIPNSKHIIPAKELDIYSIDDRLAVEYNGLWYHSSPGPNSISSLYHLDKTEACNKLGIRLIHIFEDEWTFKKDIVKSRIMNILGVSNSQRIHARKCVIKNIDSKTKNIFLEKYHIQGGDRSSIKLGAFYDNELISIMTFSFGNISKGSKKKEGVWELNRFCSNSDYHIPGIASKFLSHFKRNYSWTQIFSYADRRWSNGNLYYQLGFDLFHITKPNYWYTKGVKRIHRYNLRKRIDESKDIPEWLLRQNEGYLRIWDCGNLKFVLKNIQSLE